MAPLVSVVIAARNAEMTLGIQLAALSRQDCSVPWNVVISDNGSTDNTAAVIRAYRSRLPELVVIDSSTQAGPGFARNAGANATNARNLVFCDADDEVAPGWLAAMVAALERDPFVAGRFESSRLNNPRTLRSRRLAQADRLQESPFGPGLPHAGAGNMGVRRETFVAVGGFDPTVGCLEDTDLCWRIQQSGTPLVFHPEAVVHVRLRSSLRTMWRQGREYGRAAALLEHRYPRPPDRDPVPEAGAGQRSSTVLGGALSLLRERRSAGSLLWGLGWHVGHRERRSLPATSDRLRTSDGPTAGAA